MDEAGSEDSFRLPRSVAPRRYQLRIEPDLATATFYGTAAVTVDVAEPVDAIVCNAADLDIDGAWVTTGDGRRIDAETATDAGRERLTLTLVSTLAPGSATVHLGFRGRINDKLAGFYRSVYTDADGAEQVIATTQMEPTDARRVFPCWDEPDRKAVFSVTLVVAEGLLALSNGAVVDRAPAGDGRVVVRFADTVAMSTYLVALVVGPLEATEAVDVDGVALRVVHVPGKGHLSVFALEVGAYCLRWFRDYYDIAYPGDKCDLVALPDFAFGAMENLGAITFREQVLLVDPDAVARVELQRVAHVIAHELAHMWFGDLVTMRWWNGLWLNEAFATFMEVTAIEAFRPDWRRWESFTTDRATAFAVDALSSTRPVEYPVRSPEEAEGMFDVLTYQKGASVLRMLEQYLGADAFRAGIRRYLAAHAFANAETTDLWDAIEEATGEPVRRIMDAWIFQGGFPLVSLEHAGDGTLSLTQQAFTLAGGRAEAPGAGKDERRWPVPVLVRSGAGEIHRVLLEDGAAALDAAEPVVVNAGGHGFYRVRYDPALLGSLRRSLDALAPVERSLLVDDTWAAVLAGDTPASALLELAEGFAGERNPTVWTVLHSALAALDHVLEGEGRTRLQRWFRHLGGPALAELGWEPAVGEDELTRQTRGLVITAAGVLGDDAAVQRRAREVHRSALAGSAPVDPEVAAAALAVVASTGTAEDYEAILDRSRTAPTPQEALRHLHALARFPGVDLARRTLAMTLTDDMRSQNAPYVLGRLLANRHAGATAWAFLEEHWGAVTARFPDNSIPVMLGGITGLSTPELAPRVASFLDDHPVPQGALSVAQHRERLAVNVALREREADRLTRWLARWSH
ncbi:MAG TPA: M1 family metallopeptidase [Acidimicrobiales bacterium]|nr:M1 family metallopeptidase [Acidimicrobiales bacterium]